MTDDQPDMLYTKDVAKLVGIKVDSVRMAVQRGRLGPPDGYTLNSPWWCYDSVRKWRSTRYGKPVAPPPPPDPDRVYLSREAWDALGFAPGPYDPYDNDGKAFPEDLE